MTEYEFKKLEPDDVASNLYTCNYCGNRTEGKFYKKEDVITLLGEFLNAFSPVEESMQEIKEIFESLIKIDNH